MNSSTLGVSPGTRMLALLVGKSESCHVSLRAVFNLGLPCVAVSLSDRGGVEFRVMFALTTFA